ncbi:hypothetical protein [Selenomonas sp. AB3002]|uniref:hypothetical protein n=1 Tax=Selenomonas sp. AB3002 TaxID=1392502 RepID=UPI000ACF5282
MFGCEYRSDCYSEELARSMLGSLAEAAKEFLVKERLAEVSLLSKEAEAQLDRFNETEVPYKGLLHVQSKRAAVSFLCKKIIPGHSSPGIRCRI